ncbi:hypothetical protein A3D62_00080 [Candidatus Kaiserbacteria bacterium RIFCSPHIGHO2_02_FULL_49_11]|uniref:Capsule synthesis protein CapA domain-containing protein n=1 Tax=Candidatus Kaiserbacteria bacterium RIFCSPHIGHO2_02_FULL_49_11 TaxID=1798489 RepID=A0A1F6D0F1_9BACT|nr:MAG: hypothetical protein A3D62_00080 [Candidatus Kaiserbacteria bacterium RIFCSPHIGHO2_02_FULL_49_11]
MTPGSNPGVPTMKTPIAFLVLGTILVLGLSVGGTFLAYKNFPQEKKLNGNGKILIVGDMLFDRQIRLVGQERGEDLIFSCIKPFLLQADMVVGNLEGPITELASVSAGSVPESPENYRFTFPTTTAEVLQRHNITGVNLGNNHMGNFGEEGIIKTQEYLRRSGVHFFGGLRGDEPLWRSNLNGVPMTFVSYNQFGGQSAESVAEVIAKERAAERMVIVYAHWGDEYVPPPQELRDTARLFVTSGAAMIVGSHPHIVLEHEYMDGVPVYYSLGNFIFDQYWNEDVSTGLVLTLHIADEDINIQEHRVVLNQDGRTCLSAR